MKKLDYKKPIMKVYPLILNEPILAGSDPNSGLGGEDNGETDTPGGA